VTLEQLRIFVAVAEREHVTRAAAQLGLTQSATSAAIQALERHHGTVLFDRVGRNVELTEAGRAFLIEARAVLARAESAETVLAEHAGLRRGTLPVQASQTIAAYWLPSLLVRFHAQWPGIALRLAIGNTAQVARAVHEGEAAVGFVEGAVHDPVLAATVVARDRLVVVVAPAHALARRMQFGPAELSSTQWVMRERGSGTRAEFEAAMVRLGAKPEVLGVALELPSNESVRAAVEAGAGAAALSELVVAESIAAGRLVALPVDLSTRFFSALVHRSRYRSRAVQALLDLIGHAGDSTPDFDSRF